MHSRPLQFLRTVLLVVVVVGLVVGARLALDMLVGSRGWYVLIFLGVFATAYLSSARAAAAVTLLLGASRIVLPGTLEPGTPAQPSVLVDLVLDLVTGAAATIIAVALRSAGQRVIASDRTAEARAAELTRAARREAEMRRLATDVADPLSIRQIADLFARRARSLLDADGVTVIAGPSMGGRPAGGRDDAVLGSDGRTADPYAAEAGVEEASASGRSVRDASGRVVVPLLAETGAVAVAVIAVADDRPVGDDDLDGLLLLGRIAGEAMARSELAATSRRESERATLAAERIGRLQALAASLGRELDGEAIARLTVDAATDGTGSGIGVLSRVDADRHRLELLHARGYPVGLLEAERDLPLDLDLPAPTVARTGRPVRVDAAGWKAGFPGASDLPAIAGLDQLVALPVGGSIPLAVLLVGRAGRARYEVDEIAFLEAVAEHAAQALRRALLVDLLRDRDRRLGLTLGVARAGSWELDVATGRVEVSAELRRLYGIDDATTIETLDDYLDRVDPVDRDTVRDAVGRAATGAAPFTVEFRATRPSGPALRMLGVGRTFDDERGRPLRLMAIDRDVTPERAAEAERERLLEQEREARRMSEAFFGVMSHELRTPVTTIIAGARLIGRGTPLEPADRELVDDIAFEANRLHRLIDDMLVLSRIERGNLVLALEPVHVGHLISRVVEHEQRRWPETTFELGEREPYTVIEGEDTYVEQVLRNLLSNAAKYSPIGSVVRVLLAREGDEVVVRILDEGPGIGVEELGDLFTLFYRSPTTAATASGAGIGLFVCDRLVRAMGGRIWARRRPEGGSEFGFALKAIADDESDEALTREAAREPRAVP